MKHPTGIAAVVAPLVLWAVSSHLGPAQAAVIYLQGNDTPIAGFLVELTDQRVSLRQIGEDGSQRVVNFPRTEVREVIVSYAPERLRALDPARPGEYRDYAEELAARRIDPEAVELAIRLYLIAAYFSDDTLRASALRGLVPLARSPDEERRFRALAYRYDRHHDRSLLVSPALIQLTPDRLAESSRDAIRNVIRLLRSGQGSEARRRAENPIVERAFETFEEILTHEAFLQACFEDPIPDSVLRQLLMIEFSLIDVRDRSDLFDGASDTNMSWGETVLTDPGPVRMLTLETVTEFDPSHCLFRDGSWTAPGG